MARQHIVLPVNSSSVVNTIGLVGKNSVVIAHDDATWILASAFIVFTMQSGNRNSMSLTDVLDALDIPSGSEDEMLSDDGEDEVVDECSEYSEESVDESSEDDADTSSQDEHNRQAGVENRKVRKIWHWIKKDLPPHVTPENNLAPKGPTAQARSPLEMLLCHFDEELIDILTLESNRLRTQLQRTRVTQISNVEMKRFLGITMYMSIVELPFRRMYWSAYTRQPRVADVMTVNRFGEILSLLHANDNELQKRRGEAGYDAYYKVRPLITKLNENFLKCAEYELHIAVDEQIIPFKGRHSLKVYMKNKPKKWGYKVWVLSGQSGYAHKLQFYGDNTTKSVTIPDDIGKSGEVVFRLTQGMAPQSYVFFDNYFASPALLLALRNSQIYATCTLNKNRTKGCPLKCQKDLKKVGRGSFDYRQDTDSNILVLEWFDNRIVNVGSNEHGVEPVAMVKRYDRKEKKYIEVQCPNLITAYNKSMGGVDKTNMLLSLYRITMKTRKWYKRIIFHLLDLCIINSWILYIAAINSDTQLVTFKTEVAMSLLQYETARNNPVHNVFRPQSPTEVKSKKVSEVPGGVRYDRVGHFPAEMQLSTAQRCKREDCKRRTRVYCTKCSVWLCVECFQPFHVI